MSDERLACIHGTSGKSDLISSQGISVSTPLEAENSGSSDITFGEGRLLLRCLFKVGLPVQLNPGNQLSSRDDTGCMELSSSSSAEIVVPSVLRRVSQGILLVA